jgi:tryptophanyl-tRNA synthetase
MQMYTDPTRLHANDPGHIENNPVFTYLDGFDPNPAEVSNLKELYRAGKVGDVEVKRYLAGILNEALTPHRQRRANLAAHPQNLLDILEAGSHQARIIARQTIEVVMEKMGLKAGIALSETFAMSHNTTINGPAC